MKFKDFLGTYNLSPDSNIHAGACDSARYRGKKYLGHNNLHVWSESQRELAKGFREARKEAWPESFHCTGTPREKNPVI